ncbi:hypothetical protein [Escherichia coli]|uniref:hypothetical protein n=1 Tax=Escherichia coli TaxID=562 RepID=UPI000DE8DB2E|nr:hypothetical protein [Escherichia coli]RBW37571.1 hypothetical protein B9M90_09175 [Escherichia coli]RBW38794.1 hypothetical protein B9M91_06920 [Escherichia coli]
MESNIKGLVAAGHEMASELKAECGAVDMRSVAKLISDLATQLEVQLVRANAMAAENVALRSKAAELAHEASKIYSAYNATITEPDGDFMDMQTLHEMQCIETPATDAFLAEVRAQGVEMFAECAYTLEHHDHAVAFAAELREGGNQ